MTYQSAAIQGDPTTLPNLPGWVTSGRAETLETVAFRSGAALTVLDQLLSDPAHGVPVKLLGNRLALKASTATSKVEGRLTREADIRDAYHLTPPGEARGPDGDLLAFWRQAAGLRVTGPDWHVRLEEKVGPGFTADVGDWLEAGAARSRSHGALAGCVEALRLVLKADDRAERIAFLLTDIVLARALGWPSVLPISACRLTKTNLRDLIATCSGADLAIQTQLLASVEDAICASRDLSRRAAALKAITPKLRSKGSDAAVALFLSEDAVVPSGMLSPTIRGTNQKMTSRAARRLCDRLVELGAAHELTGRPTFRLYGIAP